MGGSSDLFIMTLQRSSSTQCSSHVATLNLTHVTEFHLLGLSEDPAFQPILFGLFLSMYLITVPGNLLIILAITSDPHLHTPMYFFLSILSLDDNCFTSTTVLKLLADIQTHSRAISYSGCLTQMCLVIIFGCMDDILLTVMAYDRYMATCHPLYYSVLMNPRFCIFLVLASFCVSLLDSQLHNLIVFQFTYIKQVEILGFCCKPAQILHLDCSDTFAKSLLTYLVAALFGFLPISGILLSYCKIISSILQITSSGGKSKAFSTCGTHLLVVCLFYGTAVGVYLESVVFHSFKEGKVASVMYTVVAPMLNPFIYSLRNKDIKATIRKLYSGRL
ncbi:olfactory receptor 7E24-like [Thomomys bottae]